MSKRTKAQRQRSLRQWQREFAQPGEIRGGMQCIAPGHYRDRTLLLKNERDKLKQAQRKAKEHNAGETDDGRSQ